MRREREAEHDEYYRQYYWGNEGSSSSHGEEPSPTADSPAIDSPPSAGACHRLTTGGGRWFDEYKCCSEQGSANYSPRSPRS